MARTGSQHAYATVLGYRDASPSAINLRAISAEMDKLRTSLLHASTIKAGEQQDSSQATMTHAVEPDEAYPAKLPPYAGSTMFARTPAPVAPPSRATHAAFTFEQQERASAAVMSAAPHPLRAALHAVGGSSAAMASSHTPTPHSSTARVIARLEALEAAVRQSRPSAPPAPRSAAVAVMPVSPPHAAGTHTMSEHASEGDVAPSSARGLQLADLLPEPDRLLGMRPSRAPASPRDTYQTASAPLQPSRIPELAARHEIARAAAAPAPSHADGEADDTAAIISRVTATLMSPPPPPPQPVFHDSDVRSAPLQLAVSRLAEAYAAEQQRSQQALTVAASTQRQLEALEARLADMMTESRAVREVVMTQLSPSHAQGSTPRGDAHREQKGEEMAYIPSPAAAAQRHTPQPHHRGMQASLEEEREMLQGRGEEDGRDEAATYVRAAAATPSTSAAESIPPASSHDEAARTAMVLPVAAANIPAAADGTLSTLLPIVLQLQQQVISLMQQQQQQQQVLLTVAENSHRALEAASSPRNSAALPPQSPATAASPIVNVSSARRLEAWQGARDTPSAAAAASPSVRVPALITSPSLASAPTALPASLRTSPLSSSPSAIAHLSLVLPPAMELSSTASEDAPSPVVFANSEAPAPPPLQPPAQLPAQAGASVAASRISTEHGVDPFFQPARRTPPRSRSPEPVSAVLAHNSQLVPRAEPAEAPVQQVRVVAAIRLAPAQAAAPAHAPTALSPDAPSSAASAAFSAPNSPPPPMALTLSAPPAAAFTSPAPAAGVASAVVAPPAPAVAPASAPFVVPVAAPVLAPPADAVASAARPTVVPVVTTAPVAATAMSHVAVSTSTLDPPTAASPVAEASVTQNAVSVLASVVTRGEVANRFAAAPTPSGSAHPAAGLQPLLEVPVEEDISTPSSPVNTPPLPPAGAGLLRPPGAARNNSLAATSAQAAGAAAAAALAAVAAVAPVPTSSAPAVASAAPAPAPAVLATDATPIPMLRVQSMPPILPPAAGASLLAPPAQVRSMSFSAGVAPTPTPAPAPPPAAASAASSSNVDEDLKTFVLSLLNGMVFLKHGRLTLKGPQRRLLWLDATSAELMLRWGRVEMGTHNLESEVVHLGDITAVSTGQSTSVLKWSGRASNEGKYWSLQLPDRTLDFECASQNERDFVVANFVRIVDDVPALQNMMLHVYTQGLWHPDGVEPVDEEEEEGDDDDEEEAVEEHTTA